MHFRIPCIFHSSPSTSFHAMSTPLHRVLARARQSQSSTLDLEDAGAAPDGEFDPGAGLDATAGFALAEVIAENPDEFSFKVVKIGFSELGSEALDVVFRGLEQTSVVELHLNRAGLEDGDCENLAELVKENPELRVLNLANNGISAEGVQHIVDALLLRANPEHADPGSHNNPSSTVTPISLKPISLDLSGNLIGTEGARQLLHLIDPDSGCSHHRRRPPLHSLFISDCGIDDDAASFLCNALKKGAVVKHLKLSNNPITAATARQLSDTLSSPSCVLRSLHLHGNPISDYGLSSLSRALSTNRTLRLLDIGCTGLSSASRDVLEKLISENPVLERLDVRGNGFKLQSVHGVEIRQGANDPAFVVELGDSEPQGNGAEGSQVREEPVGDMKSNGAPKNPKSAPPSNPSSSPTLSSASDLPISMSSPPLGNPPTPNPATPTATPATPLSRPTATLPPPSAPAAPSTTPGASLVSFLSSFSTTLANLQNLRVERLKNPIPVDAKAVDSASGLDVPWWTWLTSSGLPFAARLAGLAAPELPKLGALETVRKELGKLQDRIRKSKLVPNALIAKRTEQKALLLQKIEAVLSESSRSPMDAISAELESWMSEWDANSSELGKQTAGPVGVEPEVALRAVDEWRRANSDADGRSKRTDAALARLRALQIPGFQDALDSWTKAAAEFDAALQDEMEGVGGTAVNARATAPIPQVVSAARLLHTRVSALLDQTRGVRGVIEGLKRERERLLAPPPETGKLGRLLEESDKALDALAEATIKLRSAERSKDPNLPARQSALLSLRQAWRAGKYPVRIARERARVYRAAVGMYPELLIGNSELAKQIGIEEGAPDVEARRMGLLLEGMSLKEFADSTALKNDRSVLRVRDAEGLIWVLKRFATGADGGKSVFSHLAELARFEDPRIVAVTALFNEGPNIYLQMPYYAGGDLAQWIRARKPGQRDQGMVRRIMRDVLKALSVFHGKGLVHGDLKTSNVFISQSGRAVLGDFVGAVDVKSLGKPPNPFWAPELKGNKPGIKFTQESDIYAVGRIAAELFQGMGWGWKADVDKLLSEKPEARPTAGAALRLSAFDVPTVEPKRCGSCDEVFEPQWGAMCGQGHFMCNPCFEKHLQLPTTAAAQGAVLALPCWETECSSAPIPVQASAKIPPKAVESLRQRKAKADKQDAALALEHLLRIRSSVLALRCPKCHRHYDEFTGCFALECPSCGIGFCGYCLADCGDSDTGAFDHVAECGYNPTPGEIFAPLEVYVEIQAGRRKRMVAEYWGKEIAGLGEGVKIRVREGLRGEVEKDGVDVDALI